MKPLTICSFVLSLALITGCGSGTPANEGQEADATAANGASAPVMPSPTDVVSLFLDEIRRGGQDSSAQSLLTQRAQAELSRIGHTVQPIGSPDARFDVTRAQPVPGEANAALVHSLWREPAADGTLQDYQVVWAVEKEAAGWRISGLAIEVAPKPTASDRRLRRWQPDGKVAGWRSGEHGRCEPHRRRPKVSQFHADFDSFGV